MCLLVWYTFVVYSLRWTLFAAPLLTQESTVMEFVMTRLKQTMNTWVKIRNSLENANVGSINVRIQFVKIFAKQNFFTESKMSLRRCNKPITRILSGFSGGLGGKDPWLLSWSSCPSVT